jgi:hypothetical protein
MPLTINKLDTIYRLIRKRVKERILEFLPVLLPHASGTLDYSTIDPGHIRLDLPFF